MSDFSNLSTERLLAMYKAAKDPLERALSLEGVQGPLADLARSIYAQESSAGKNTRTSNAGAVGGMQIRPGTFAGVADKDWDINDPTQNARAGIRYLKQGYEAAGGDPALAGAFYYGGPGGLEKARRGVAVSDPRNPNAPNTLQYGAQVASRLPEVQNASQAATEQEESPFARMSTEELLRQYKQAKAQEVAPADTQGGATGSWESEAPQPNRAAFGIYPNARRQAKNNTPNASDAIVMGLARGVKDPIDTGAELLATGYDKLTGGGPNVSGLVTGQQGEGTRVRAMNQKGKQDFADQYGDSSLASVARVGGNVLATAPVGGVLAAPVRAAAPVVSRAAPAAGNALSRLGNALSSGGFTVGGAPSTTLTGAAGNMLLRSAGGATSGAVGAGLIDPDATGFGAAIGGALPPTLRAAGAVGGAASGAVRTVRDLATRAGQDRIAGNILLRSATNPEQAAGNLLRARPLVPGSNPTVGQAAQDPGLAQLERTLINNPETAPALQQRFAQQRVARASAIDDVAATGPNSGSYYDDINEGRRVFANEDYARARAEGINPEMAASMQHEVASLMERPSIQAAMTDARRLAAETGETISDIGSVQGLDWVKKALDNQISKARGANSSIGAEDLRALMQTRNDLNATLEQLSPAYREANRNYAAMSRQINGMDVARGLDAAYTPAAANFGASAKEQGNAFMKAMRKAQDSVKQSTGRDQTLAQTMSTEDIHALENVARDLARKEYAETAGRSVGSPTAQNMLSQYFIERVLGDAGLPQGLLSGAQGSTLLQSLLRPVEFAGRTALPRVQNRLAELALSPEEAALALRRIRATRTNALAVPSALQELTFRGAPVAGVGSQ
ncbi:transglycosylase SLT domain-containing protein [Variovorax guangxiensis]|uniref:Transglycosylase SLT domain-containing protein n=1 Tax=Variovorax guangxiensis TaxID=1775474 RepID=A0A840FTV2_9BURK|nr:transglycosylase SLT domain-containing protein [Variovorax guangxiensis]MBB4226026.1 hypothetical protein [Variovorax guangxiensis]